MKNVKIEWGNDNVKRWKLMYDLLYAKFHIFKLSFPHSIFTFFIFYNSVFGTLIRIRHTNVNLHYQYLLF